MRKTIIILLTLIVGCAGTAAVVDMENLPKLKSVTVVSYENQTGYPFLTDAFKAELEKQLKEIASPKFVLDSDAAVGVTREALADPGKRQSLRTHLNTDALLFCTITHASIPGSVSDGKEGIDMDVETAPSGQLGGGEKVTGMSISFKSTPNVKVSAAVDIISLETGLPLYHNQYTQPVPRRTFTDRELLKRAAEYCAYGIMEKYDWPGLER